jgi:diguanylate cyclase (GGDEF)-like protein
VIDSGRPLLVGADGLSGYLQAEMEAYGIRNLIAVPMPIDFTPGGVLVVISTRTEEIFSPREMMLLQTIAEQAGLAIQKARLYENQGRRARELDALRETMADISSELEVDRLLNKILQRAMDLLGVTEGELCLYVPEEQVLQTVASQNRHGDFRGRVYRIGEGPRGETAATRQPMIFTDEKQWETGLDGEEGEPHDLLLVPLLAGSELMGVISMGANRMQRRFTQADIRLLELFAQEATIAIRNANLFDQVHTLAITDSLTGLYNRRHFFFLAQSELERALRYQHPLSILMIDIDHFKQVNDTYGHTSGDQALLAVAQRCKTWLRQVDLIGRYGGEEIVVLLPETTPDAALQAAERLRMEVEKIEVPSSRGTIRLTISVGVADLMDMDGINLDLVLDRADRALYLAKEGGRNRVSQWKWNDPTPEGFVL